MGYFLFFPAIFLVVTLVSGFPSSEFIHPNFTASEYQLIDNHGAFLSSHNGTFTAAIFNPGAQQTNFYLCVIHMASNTIIWSANRDAPISESGTVTLTTKGIAIADQDGKPRWSTPALQSSVYALLLTEMGNLVLLDHSNGSLWESFHHPTDTIVIGQHLAVGTYLSSAVSDYNLSYGDYRLMISTSDALQQWNQQTYWKLSMDRNAYINSNYIVEYMAINRTGLYLFGHNESVVVIQLILPPSDFRIAKLGASGQFSVSRYSSSNWVQEFFGPDDDCKIPFICGQIGLCTDNPPSRTPICSCPLGFHVGSQNMSGCVPSDGSYSLPFGCNSTNNESQVNTSLVSYLWLGYGIDYFSTDFSEPLLYGVNLSVCEDLCSRDCSCLGIFYGNSSGSCYVLENELGSIISSNAGESDLQGYIKTLAGSNTLKPKGSSSFSKERQKVPVAAMVLLPFTGFFLLVALGFLWWRRWRLSKSKEIKLRRFNSHSSEDLDSFYIPGLPKRFYYEELEVATDHFKTQIGSGGFGAVYKGTLPDKTVVAIKKITNLGVQGRKDFCTEIAIIGNIHHVNLVRLKGFCVQGRQRLLVYEYMNLGSLDRTLFGSGPVLEWQERFDIALGTARGLAYLHSGCQHKIIHCDVKPENILLDDHLQAKISDFGLSKLLSPEQSGLFTTMRGTRGYLAPEWLTNSAISERTDVYSFGMVLLELVSGRKNCLIRSQSHSMDDSNSDGGHSSSSSRSVLVYFPLLALEMHEQGKYLELADPRLQGRVTREEVEKLVRVALCCLHEEPMLRPNMVNVVGMLEGGTPLVQPVIESLNFLRFYGRRFTEASTIMEPNGSMPYPLANASTTTSTTRGFHTGFSYISSQQISGPR
jgi:serine/threonine protein kinase